MRFPRPAILSLLVAVGLLFSSGAAEAQLFRFDGARELAGFCADLIALRHPSREATS